MTGVTYTFSGTHGMNSGFLPVNNEIAHSFGSKALCDGRS